MTSTTGNCPPAGLNPPCPQRTRQSAAPLRGGGPWTRSSLQSRDQLVPVDRPERGQSLNQSPPNPLVTTGMSVMVLSHRKLGQERFSILVKLSVNETTTQLLIPANLIITWLSASTWPIMSAPLVLFKSSRELTSCFGGPVPQNTDQHPEYA